MYYRGSAAAIVCYDITSEVSLLLVCLFYQFLPSFLLFHGSLLVASPLFHDSTAFHFPLTHSFLKYLTTPAKYSLFYGFFSSMVSFLLWWFLFFYSFFSSMVSFLLYPYHFGSF